MEIKELAFALGKIYEDTGEYEKSYKQIKRANEIKKEFTKFNIENEIKFFEKIKEFQKKLKIL